MRCQSALPPPVVDSWAKVPDGLYSGNWALEGVYDECVGASSPDGDVWGKFCRVFVLYV